MATSGGAAVRAAYRRLLRAAREHDQRPHFKSLLPLSAGCTLPYSSPNSMPLKEITRALVRRAASKGSTNPESRYAAAARKQGVSVMSEQTTWLTANLHRKELYARKQKHRLDPSNVVLAQLAHPNHTWFQQKMDAACLKTSMQEDDNSPSSSSTGDPLDVLLEMLAVRCPPTLHMFEKAIQTLERTGRLERALQAFWLLELRSPHTVTPDIASALISGALQTSKSAKRRENSQATSRALAMFRVFDETADTQPDQTMLNRLLSRSAQFCSSRRDLRHLLDAMDRIRNAGSNIFDRTFGNLMEACVRFSDMPALFKCFTVQKHTYGGSCQADKVAVLLEWSRSEGKLEWVEELEKESLKLQYLAQSSNPHC
eukprot:jgi/Chlat1/3564/Chrsp234S03562